MAKQRVAALMVGPSMEDLRELSRRSRRTQRVGFLSFFAVLVAIPFQLVLARWLEGIWLAAALIVVGGAAFVSFAFVVGEERGAFRRVFKKIADERRAAKE